MPLYRLWFDVTFANDEEAEQFASRCGTTDEGMSWEEIPQPTRQQRFTVDIESPMHFSPVALSLISRVVSNAGLPAKYHISVSQDVPREQEPVAAAQPVTQRFVVERTVPGSHRQVTARDVYAALEGATVLDPDEKLVVFGVPDKEPF